VAFSLAACGIEEPSPTGEVLTWETGKGDSTSCTAVDQLSADLTVLRASTKGRAASASNTVPANFNIDGSRCNIVASEPYDGFDCQFYDVCEVVTLDCTSHLKQLVWNTPFTHRVQFERVYHMANATEDRYLSETMNCQVVEITTVTRDAALTDADAIGFYYDGHTTVIPRQQWKNVGSATLANGEAATLHAFGGLSVCWGGSFSSSRGAVEFKPFLLHRDDDTCYRNWDDVPQNYRIGLGDAPGEFDRSHELLKH
jgi:hypothetical protein